MKKIVLALVTGISLIALTSSYCIDQKEVVKATSSWFYSNNDADNDCRARLAQQGGDTRGDVRFYGREQKLDDMKRTMYKTSCSCYKKDENK